MAIIAFEHMINIINPLKKAVMSIGSGGEIVHCEIIFENYSLEIGSSWNPVGTQIRPYKARNHNNWLYYGLGIQNEARMYNYIKEKTVNGYGYTLMGLVTNMILNYNIPYHNKNFCSELCFDTLKYAGSIAALPNVNGRNVSPNELHQMILDLGFKQVYL